MAPNSDTASRMNRTICMYFCQAKYEIIVQKPQIFREEINKTREKHPELFPPEIKSGFKMKEIRVSKKMNLKIRRIIISGISYSIRPSFAMPYMTGLVQDVEKPLFLRKFAVPFWALSYCYGKDAMYWYRLETSLGRNSIVGTTIKSTNKLSTHIVADEKHTRLLGNKTYIATTAANNCILGACVSESASEKQLTKAYGIFKEEVESVIPTYKPETVNTDGWLPTQNSWKTLFPQITVIACFLHIYIGIRDRSKKKYKEVFNTVATKLWDCYKAESKSSFSQRVRRLSEWCSKSGSSRHHIGKN